MSYIQNSSSGGGSAPGGATNSVQFNAGSSTFGGSGILSPMGSVLPNPLAINIYKNITSTGDTDLYTVPANRRAIVCETTFYNNSGSPGLVFNEVKIGGVYYQTVAAGGTLSNNLATTRSSHYILEAGETFAVSAAMQPINVWAGALEFDNTSNLKSAKLTTFVAGNNTVYTVPNGKSAILFPNTLLMCSGVTGTLSYGNLSGTPTVTTRTITLNLVKSGGSVGTTNQICPTTTVANPSLFAPSVTGLTLSAGDFYSVNTDSNAAGQFAFVTVVEI